MIGSRRSRGGVTFEFSLELFFMHAEICAEVSVNLDPGSGLPLLLKLACITHKKRSTRVYMSFCIDFETMATDCAISSVYAT